MTCHQQCAFCRFPAMAKPASLPPGGVSRIQRGVTECTIGRRGRPWGHPIAGVSHTVWLAEWGHSSLCAKPSPPSTWRRTALTPPS